MTCEEVVKLAGGTIEAVKKMLAKERGKRLP